MTSVWILSPKLGPGDFWIVQKNLSEDGDNGEDLADAVQAEEEEIRLV